MKEKKKEIITFRTDSDTKDKIERLSEEKEWSVSQVVEKICKEYFSKIKSEKENKNGNNI